VLLLIGVTVLISVGIAVWSVMAQTWQESVALALVLGGALGNLIDRVRDGMVTDFIDLHAAGYHWPTLGPYRTWFAGDRITTAHLMEEGSSARVSW